MHFFQQMGRDEDRALTRHRVDQHAHRVFLVGIEAVGGLVEHQHRRIVQDRLRQAHAAAKTFRERADGLLEHVFQFQPHHHFVETAKRHVAIEAAHADHENEELADGHLAVARRTFGQVAKRALGREGLLAHVVTAHARRTRRRREEARDHAHGRGLAGAVGTKQAEHLARLGTQAQRVDRGQRAVATGESVGFDHRVAV